jgi:spermidine synthase
MTRDLSHWAYRAVSFVWELRSETAPSDISGHLQVRMVSGRLLLDAPHANYSFGSLHTLFRKVFRHIDLKSAPPANTLLLGLGGGSVVSIIRNEYHLDVPITAVEADPEVLRIARAHFGLSSYQNLEVICLDASDYMKTATGLYNLIIVDIFVDNNVPEPFTNLPFLEKCRSRLAPGGRLVFNFILLSDTHRAQYGLLLKNIDIAGLHYSEMRVFATNRVLILRHKDPSG